MTNPVLSRSGLIGATLAAAIAGTVGFSEIGRGAALVGDTHRFFVSDGSGADLDGLKAGYRRPAFIPFPRENTYTLAKAALGKKLYFDPRLSVSSTRSCASCHSPGFGWGDGQTLGVGPGMKKLDRRTPTIVNLAWGAIFMWDGRAPDLERQALGPIEGANEMNMPLAQLMKRLEEIAEYKMLFAAAFPEAGMSPATLAAAIATYERTIVSEQSPFDAWIEGDENAIPDAAKRGFELFNHKAACATCHSRWNFTDDSFHDTGLADQDMGRSKIVPGVLKMEHAFKTPGLREIARRGPYMHDGSLPTLAAVMDHYNNGGIDRPSRSDQIAPLGLSKQDCDDLVAFLTTMTSDMAPTPFPVLPR
jgi:cytochrome c peroxidase